MDSDYLAFRELLKQTERDPAAELSRLMQAGAPLRDLLALRVPEQSPGNSPQTDPGDSV